MCFDIIECSNGLFTYNWPNFSKANKKHFVLLKKSILKAIDSSQNYKKVSEKSEIIVRTIVWM